MHPIRFNVKFYNVILLGLSFMLLFTAFQTLSIIENVVLKSISKDDTNFDGKAYTSLAIIYGVLAVANWAAPSVVSFTGPKNAMIGGAVTYLIFIASFLYPREWLLYLSSALVGLGAACIWTGQGNFLTINSDSNTMGRNSGIFWAMLQSSLLFGNLFVFFKFNGAETIDLDNRRTVFIVLLVVGCIGFAVMFLLRSIKTELPPSGELEESISNKPIEALKKSFHLFLSRDMLLLSITFFYTGIELGFFSGIYGSSIGFTNSFGASANSLVGLNGIFIGVGEILGGALFGIMGAKTNRFGRDPIVILGYLIHMITFYLIFINLPFHSPLDHTSAKAFIPSSKIIAILCSFLLGFGDSCFNTQIYSLLGTIYPDDSAPAFALFKFIQSLGATAIFLYSLYLELQWHIAILIVTGTVGTFSFCVVEWKLYERLAKKSRELEVTKE